MGNRKSGVRNRGKIYRSIGEKSLSIKVNFLNFSPFFLKNPRFYLIVIPL